MKKLVALGTAYVIGQIIAGLEVGIAISSINRKKELVLMSNINHIAI